MRVPARTDARCTRHLPSSPLFRGARQARLAGRPRLDPSQLHDRAVSRRLPKAPFRTETIEGIAHHWVWTPGGIHRSRKARVANYAGFARLQRRGQSPCRAPMWCSCRLRRSPWPGSGRYSHAGSAVPGCSRFETSGRSRRPRWAGCTRRGVAYRLAEHASRTRSPGAPTVIVPTPGLEPLVRAHGAREVCVLPGIVSARQPDPEQRRRTRERLGSATINASSSISARSASRTGSTSCSTRSDSLPATSRRGRRRRRRQRAPTHSQKRSPPRALERGSRCFLRWTRTGSATCSPPPTSGCTCCDRIRSSARPCRPRRSSISAPDCPSSPPCPACPSEVAVASGGAAVSVCSRAGGEFVSWSEATATIRRTRGQQALRYGLDNFGLEANVDRLERLLAQTLAEPPPR